MQTFLPYSDFTETARCLDYRRLGKQRVEAMQILNIVENRTHRLGWKNHPAVVMWMGHAECLKFYMNSMINEWIRRGYKNSMKIEHVRDSFDRPWWINDSRLIVSHRSNLIRKDRDFYGGLWPNLDGTLPYFWPSKQGSTNEKDIAI